MADSVSYRIFLLPPVDKRLGVRLDDSVQLGIYNPEDPAWVAGVGDSFTFEGVIYSVALPTQAGDGTTGSAGDIYVAPA